MEVERRVLLLHKVQVVQVVELQLIMVAVLTQTEQQVVQVLLF